MLALAVVSILVWYAALSVIAFAAFALDKRRAQLDLRRTPERTLHTLSFLGGFPGAFAAMALVRHKNRKLGFVLITFAAAAAHILLWAVLGELLLSLR